MADQKYYKLGAVASVLHDPTQKVESNKTLYMGMALPMEDTPRVKKWLAHGAIEVVDKAEADELMKAHEATKTEAKKISDKKDAAHKELSDTKNKELQKEMDAIQAKSNDKDTEIAELKKQLEKGGTLMQTDNDEDVDAKREQYKEIVGKDADDKASIEDMDTEIQLVVADEYVKVIGDAPADDATVEDMQEAIKAKKAKK